MRLISILPLIGLVTCLFEDQVGKFDWKLGVVGYPTLVAFDDTNGPSESIAVFTKQGILASLSGDDGKILWQRTMPQIENVEHLYFANRMIISISSGGIARYWDNQTGALLKEAYSKDNGIVGSCARLYSKSVVFCSRQLATKSVVTIFRERQPLSEIETSFLAKKIITNEANNVAYLIGDDGDHTVIETLHISDLTVSEPSSIELGVLSLSSSSLISADELLIEHDAGLTKVMLATGVTSQEFLEPGCNLIPNSQTESRHAPEDYAVQCRNTIVIKSNTGDKSYTGTHGKILSKLSSGNMLAFHDDLKKWTLFFAVKSARAFDSRVEIKSLWTKPFDSKQKPNHLQILLLGGDGTLSLAEAPSKGIPAVTWIREESLSEVANVQIIDLPPVDAHLDDPSEWSFIKRLRIQMGLFRAQFAHLNEAIQSGKIFQKRIGDPLVSTNDLIRDKFNLHKLILVVTRNGNVFGIDSLNKNIIWRGNIPEINQCSIQVILTAETIHQNGRVMVVGKCLADEAKLYEVNVMNGSIKPFESTTGEILRAEVLRTHKDHFHPIIVFAKAGAHVNVDLIGAVRDEVATELENTSFWLFDKSSQRIFGGHVHLDSATKGTFHSSWTFQLPSNMEISMITSAPSTDIIHSQGRPLADRSVMEKYLNPNLIGVLANSKETKDIEIMSVTAFFLDGSTGEVLHSSSHKRCTGLGKITLSENWAVYSYWSAKMYRTEITSVEFYRGSGSENSTHWDSMDSAAPIAIQKSFVSSEEISSLAVSQSQRGITNKAVLMGTRSGKIVSLPRMFLDPRRRIVPVATDREEGIMPYEPELKFPPNFIISYNQTLGEVYGINVAITGLESTCAVLAVTQTGLVWTRIQPSGMFDVLKDDFDHFMIALILVGFVIGTYVCKIMAQKKITNRLWQ